MKLIPHLLVAVAGSWLLALAPQTGSAAAATQPAYTKTQTDTATAQMSRALKTAGASSIQTATSRQLAAAAAVVASNKGSKSFLGSLAYALIVARPELTIPIAKMLLADLTPPGECPAPEYIHEITWAVVKANPTASPEIARALIEEYPCRAAVITGAAVAATPATAKAIVVAAFGAAPAGAFTAIVTAANQAGGSVGDMPINPALTNMPSGAGTLNNSAATINPANINAGGSSTTVQTNSPDNSTGG